MSFFIPRLSCNHIVCFACQTAEQQDWQLEHVDDYLVPHLVNLEFPETLSATDVENLVAKCVQEFKENRKTLANFLKEHYKKVEQHLSNVSSTKMTKHNGM